MKEGKVLMRRVDQLHENPLNPRGPITEKEITGLVCSIREQGILQPLLATPDGTIVAGHRRYAAARKAGLDRLPVFERDMTEREQLEAMLTENIQREDLTPLQEGRAYRALLEHGQKTMDIARNLGLQTSRIAERLMLLEMDPAVAKMFDDLELPVSAIRSIAKATDPAVQLEVAGLVARRQLRVKDIPEHLEKLANPVERPPAPPRSVKSQVKAIVKASDRETPREEALAALAEHPKRLMTFRAITDVLDATCCACGLANTGNVCAQCPLPRFVKAIVKESENVRRTA